MYLKYIHSHTEWSFSGRVPISAKLLCSVCFAVLLFTLASRPCIGQNKRLGALNKFKSKSRSVLLATDVASRGLDIPHVDCVINYDIPTHSKVRQCWRSHSWLFDDRLIWLKCVFGSFCPHRTTSTESDEQPEQDGRGNPSLLSLSKHVLSDDLRLDWIHIFWIILTLLFLLNLLSLSATFLWQVSVYA